MTVPLDELIARIPKAPAMVAEVAARFSRLPALEIERQGLDELAHWLWVMCEVFFTDSRKRDRAVSTIVTNDAFSAALAYLGPLAYANAERQDCLDVITDLLVDIASKPDRPRIEVEPAMMSAFILASVLRNVRDRNRPLAGVQSKVVQRDALYRSLDKNASLTDVLYGVRERFAPRARIL